MNDRSTWLIASLVVLLASPAAFAQDAAPEQASAAVPELKPTPLGEALSAPARIEYEAARLLYGDSDYSGALVKFHRAFEQSQDPRLLWNMAVCEKNLRHYVNVLRLLERYGRDPTRMTEAERIEVDEVVRTVRLLISTVQLTVTPDDAQVSVDDVPVGTSPLAEPLQVDLGTRQIRVRKPGYIEQRISRHFTGASVTRLEIELSPEVHEGRLAVTAGSADAISVDGKPVGRSAWQGRLASGEHTVRITAPGKRPYARDVTINDDQTRSLYVSLPPLPSGVSPLLWVGGGAIVVAALASGGYLLLRPAPTAAEQPGTWGTFQTQIK
jgi:hypothetical protein